MPRPHGVSPGDRRSGELPKENAAKYTPKGKMVSTVIGETVCVRRGVEEASLRAALQASRHA